MTDLKQTPLIDIHTSLGAKMVPFAGYLMPVQYPTGIKTEHLHTRSEAGLFDVSHMGQILVECENAALLLEGLMPSNLVDLDVGKQRYGLLMNEQGGVRDDLMSARLAEDKFLLVVNAACKEDDFAWISSQPGISATMLEDRALLALQGPKSAEVLSRAFPTLADLAESMFFMDIKEVSLEGVDLIISRSGYTGEDGFEISMPAVAAGDIASCLLADPDCLPIGLGARDSLRLEAGLCLYGHELTNEITPLQAGLGWAVSPVRRPGGAREGNYPGAAIIEDQLQNPTESVRVGIQPLGKAPVRDGAKLTSADGSLVGEVCSGGFSPSLGAPVAMAYIHRDLSSVGTRLFAEVRGKHHEVEVARLPFVANRYRRD